MLTSQFLQQPIPVADPVPKQDSSRADSPPTADSAQTFPAEPVNFRKGLIGFPDYHGYGLMELPDERLAHFRLLQSVDDADLSFLLLPLNMAEGPIAQADLGKALENLDIAEDNALVFAIVTLRKDFSQFSATANLRAPVIIDSSRQSGVQYVLSNTEYSIRHPVS